MSLCLYNHYILVLQGITITIRPHIPYKCTIVHFIHLTKAYIQTYRLGSVRSIHLPFEMHYVRSSLHVLAPTGE